MQTLNDSFDNCPVCGAPIINLPTGQMRTCHCTGNKVPPIPSPSSVADDLLEGVIRQCCSEKDRDNKIYLDSDAQPPYTAAIEYLAKIGRCKITGKAGRRVLAIWI